MREAKFCCAGYGCCIGASPDAYTRLCDMYSLGNLIGNSSIIRAGQCTCELCTSGADRVMVSGVSQGESGQVL